MSMIRSPVVYAATPAHSRIPAAGIAFWYRLRDPSETRGIEGIPALTKTLVSGSASANAYTDPTVYEMPAANGTTNVLQFIAQEDAVDLFLNRVLTMVGMVPGEQIIVAQNWVYNNHDTGNGALWTWGPNGVHSQWGFQVNLNRNPYFMWRPRNGGSNNSQALTSGGGTAFDGFKAQGRFACVMSARVMTGSTVDVEMLLGNGALSGSYTFAGIDVAAGGTENPGISGGSSMANFVGLSIGSVGASGGTNTSFFGRGTGNIAKADQTIGWRGQYLAGRTAAVLQQLTTTHKLDYPPALYADA